MSWRHLRGTKNSISTKIGAVALPVGTLVQFVGGLIVAAGLNTDAIGALRANGAVAEDNVAVEVLAPGSVWEAPVASLVLVRGTRVGLLANGTVKARSAAEWSPGIVVDKDTTATDTTVSIYIDPRG